MLSRRAALEVCALVRLTTESFLSTVLNTAGDHELFEWLRNLSFIDSEPHGLFPLDMTREALVADLRWRNPDWYAELHQRARTYYLERLEKGDRRQQRRVLFDYIFLHRDNPVVRPYFEWQESGSTFTDGMQPADRPALAAMVHKYEGQAAGRLADHWFNRQPQGVSILRDVSGQAKFFRALYHTYFQPATTQEQAAELLDLPFSTYRRHLRAGIAHVTESLWQQELGGLE